MKRNVLACSVASAFALTGAAFEAQASAFALHEQGISGLGNAYSGAAAVAEDASTVWWNPAGMARLPKGKHLAIAGALIAPSWKFNNGSSVAATGRPLGGTGGDAGSAVLVPSGFFVMDINDRMSFGVGANVPFGLKTEYDPDWIGRFQGIKSEVKTYNINPSISYKVSDSASLGFGVSFQHGEIDLLTAVNAVAVEGQNKIALKDNGYGINVGALFDVGPATRLGIHYRSPIKYNFTGDATFTGVPVAAVNVKLDLKTPDSLHVSGVHKLNDKTDLLGDFVWTHWAKIKQIPLVRTSGAAAGTTLDTLVFNFDNTIRVSGGVNYKYSQPWTLKFGAALDKSPVPNADSRTVRLPDSDRIWLTAGAKYQVSGAGAIDFGYAYIMVKDADINNTPTTTPPTKGTVNGKYEARIHVFGVQYQHSF